MFLLKATVRMCAVLLFVFSMLAFVLSGASKVRAQSQAPTPLPFDATTVPDTLSEADWAQIETILPEAAAYGQKAYIKASNTGHSSYFGQSMAMYGNTLVIGAHDHSNATGVNGNQMNNLASGSGAVFVFVRNNGVWTQQAYIKASNTDASDAFGSDVDIFGDTIVVAAPGEDSNATGVNGNQADNSLADSGAVYVFTRNGSTWSQQAYIKASNTGVDDEFGYSVAISGDTLAIGATYESSNATGVNGDQNNDLALDSGAAYIFTRNGTTWSQQAYLKASNTAQEYQFGFDIDVFGDTVVVGSNKEHSSGAVYVFTTSNGVWSQQAYIKASNPDSRDFFGCSVALWGDTLVVGAEGEDSNAMGVNGDQSNNSAGDAGAVYVFTRISNLWSQQAYIKASNTALGNQMGGGNRFGYSVDFYDNTLVVGSYGESSSATGVDGNQTLGAFADTGAAYVFVRSNNVWRQQSYLKASNTASNDRFGHSVAVSGNTVVAGALNEDSNATGINGDQSNNLSSEAGAAYLFTVLPPSVVASQTINTNPTTAPSVNFKVTFSQVVSGVDSTDFFLSTSSAINGAAITSVNGGPLIYTVSVNTGSGSGTIRLNVYDNDSIQNEFGLLLGGVGMANGNFITGGSYVVRPKTLTFQSQGTRDGWLLESSENSNMGGSINASAATLYVGDDAADKEYRSILHFNTGSLPDAAVIMNATLKLKKQGVVGSDPFTTNGSLRTVVFKPYFGGDVALWAHDFSAESGGNNQLIAGTFNPTPVNNVYSAILNVTGEENINKVGTTQFRLYFTTDDNDNQVADFIKFYSGDAQAIANQPALVVEYYVP